VTGKAWYGGLYDEPGVGRSILVWLMFAVPFVILSKLSWLEMYSAFGHQAGFLQGQPDEVVRQCHAVLPPEQIKCRMLNPWYVSRYRRTISCTSPTGALRGDGNCRRSYNPSC
jgi:hypothetical protein